MTMSMATFFFIQDLAEQCMFVRMAKIDLKKCLADDNSGLDRPYYFLQSLVIALGNISKILWPRGKYEKRGIELRTFLEINGDSALKNRDLRNLFEHFDEYADDWFAAEERGRFPDGIDDHPFRGDSARALFRSVNPASVIWRILSSRLFDIQTVDLDRGGAEKAISARILFRIDLAAFQFRVGGLLPDCFFEKL